MVNGITNFNSTIGTIMVRLVEITPKQHALIKFLLVDEGKFEKHTLIMEGNDYQMWGDNDDYLGHFIINKISDGKANLVDSEFTPISTTSQYISDNRSIHNEADVARIQSLQEQLDTQAAKLQTITDLLFKNGAI